MLFVSNLFLGSLPCHTIPSCLPLLASRFSRAYLSCLVPHACLCAHTATATPAEDEDDPEHLRAVREAANAQEPEPEAASAPAPAPPRSRRSPRPASNDTSNEVGSYQNTNTKMGAVAASTCSL
eukprot:1161558-Pelagomonas_calceolata.AAC.5